MNSAYASAEISATSIIEVDYEGYFNASGYAIGAGGNTNRAKLEYTADPVKLTETSTAESTSTVYTYELQLEKYDKANGKALANASFTIAQGNLFVQSDGSLGAQAYEFVTDANGIINVSGMDAGTYTIHESSAPSGYETMSSDMTVVITSTLNQSDGSLSDLIASVSGGKPASVSGDLASGLIDMVKATGKVSVRAVDAYSFELAAIGLSGNWLLYILAGLLALLSVSGYVVCRRRENVEK